MGVYMYVLVMSVITLISCLPVRSLISNEQRLHHYIMTEKRYNKLIRPPGNSKNNTLTVKLGMRLSQLLDVSEKNQILTSSVWLRHEWIDSRMAWAPEDFGGINFTHLPSDDLWRPDVVLYNNADGSFIVSLMTTARVYFTGLIIWEPPAIYKSYCPINVEFFPFDQQECFMKFGCWTYDGNEVDLRHIWDEQGIDIDNRTFFAKGVDLCEYYQNVEWDIINVTAIRKIKFYPCCPEPYIDIHFNITIRRKTLFYTVNLILPIISISTLTVLVFYLPSDSGEKITLSISILLALTVFFLLLSDINPPTSLVIPLIGKYLLFTMIVVSMSIFLTVYTLSVHFRSPKTHNMSPWIKRVFTDILPRILCMKRPLINKKTGRPYVKETQDTTEMKEICSNLAVTVHQLDQPTSPNYENIRKRAVSNKVEVKPYPSYVKDSVKGVKFIAEHLKKDDEERSDARDWNYVAMVMDRLFLFIFTTACLCGTIGIFLNAPSLYDPRLPMSKYDFDCSKREVSYNISSFQ